MVCPSCIALSPSRLSSVLKGIIGNKSGEQEMGLESFLAPPELLSKSLTHLKLVFLRWVEEEGLDFISHYVCRRLYNILQNVQTCEKIYYFICQMPIVL